MVVDTRKQNIECNANSTHKPVGDDVLDVPKRTIRCDKISTYAETITVLNRLFSYLTTAYRAALFILQNQKADTENSACYL